MNDEPPIPWCSDRCTCSTWFEVFTCVSAGDLRKVAAWIIGRQWQPIETAPQDGFFLVWSPDHPEIPMVVRASIFHHGRREGTPKHLSFSHFTRWMPIPEPPR